MRRLLAAAVLVLLAAPAGAGSPPPDAMFLSGDAKQKGRPGSYCWDGTCADRIPGFPKQAERADAGAKARIRIKHKVKPRGVAVDGYRELDEYGRPAGEPESLPVELSRKKRDGKTVAWDAVFRLPEESGKLYVTAFAGWRHDPERPEGDASWFFHLKLRD